MRSTSSGRGSLSLKKMPDRLNSIEIYGDLKRRRKPKYEFVDITRFEYKTGSTYVFGNLEKGPRLVLHQCDDELMKTSFTNSRTAGKPKLLSKGRQAQELQLRNLMEQRVGKEPLPDYEAIKLDNLIKLKGGLKDMRYRSSGSSVDFEKVRNSTLKLERCRKKEE